MSTLTLTGIQASLFWENPLANRNMLEEKINSIDGKTELVILPETFSTGFSMKPALLAEKMEGETMQWMRRISSGKKIILTGSVIIEEEGSYFNRMIWMQPDGNYGAYDKRHLFAYAGENREFSPGKKRVIAQVKGWKINLQICYDLRFPVWSRQAPRRDTHPEYDVLIYIANWPERRNHAWKTLLQARAIENQCFVVGVNRVGNDGNGIYHSGDSMVIDPMGEILFTKSHEEAVFTLTLQKDKLDKIRTQFPFWKDRDFFTLHAG